MFCAEMKKIWKPGITILIVMISFLIFSAFMFRCVKPFLLDDGSDSTEVTLELCSHLIAKYGNTIEEEEFSAIKNEYKQLLYGADTMIAETDLFVENNVGDYEDYLQYMQNAIQGYDGYDYNTYAKMRDRIIQATGKSAMYFEVYEDMMQQYQSADTGRSSILPFEVLAYASEYFVFMLIWCMTTAFFIAAPVMVNDRENHMIANLYSSRKGKKIHIIQYLCMTISVLILVSVIVFGSMLIWKETRTLQYADSYITSFLNQETSVIPLTYGDFVCCYIGVAYVLTLGITNIVFYLSVKSTNAIHMLIRAIPVLLFGCFIGLCMGNMLCESNCIYKLLPIPGCELIMAVIILVTGVFLNVRSYRKL